jgi:hypothetical protein
MKAIRVREFGGPEVLPLEDMLILDRSNLGKSSFE